MKSFPQRPRKWSRAVLATVLIVVVMVGGLRAAHWAALKYVDSLAPSAPFAQVRLRPGLSEPEVVGKLGAPESRLRHAPVEGEPAAEILRYVRGRHTLELSLVDGRLDRWTETQPGGAGIIKFGRDLPSECCEPRTADAE